MTTTDSEERDRAKMRVFGSAGEALAWLENIQNAGRESWRVEMHAELDFYRLTARRIFKTLGDEEQGPLWRGAQGKTLIEAIAWLRYAIEDVQALPQRKRNALKEVAPDRAKLIAEVNALNEEFCALADERDALLENDQGDHERAREMEITMLQKAVFARITQIGLEATACSTPTQQTS